MKLYLDKTQIGILKRAKHAGYILRFKPRHDDEDDGYLSIQHKIKGSIIRIHFSNSYRAGGISYTEYRLLQNVINTNLVKELSVLEQIAHINTRAPFEQQKLNQLVNKLPLGWRQEFKNYILTDKLYYEPCCLRWYTPIDQLYFIVRWDDAGGGYYVSVETHTLGGAKKLHERAILSNAELIEVAAKHYAAHCSVLITEK